MIKTPRVGDIVHFVMPAGSHLPAIVTATFGEQTVDLVVFMSARASAGLAACEARGTVPHGDAKPGTWHWPGPDES